MWRRWTRKVAVDPSPADPPKPMQPAAAELAAEGAPAQPSTAESGAAPAAAPAPWRPGGGRREGAAPAAGMSHAFFVATFSQNDILTYNTYFSFFFLECCLPS